jgi:hypothetical protein
MTTTTDSGPNAKKHFSSSILLWVRDDQPRQQGLDYWKGPHSGIISATPGLLEYRQIHLAEVNAGQWPAVNGVETAIPVERKIDGLAEVTFRSPLSPLQGRTQTKLAYQDEVNVFRRTLLYAGLPGSSRWYDVAPIGSPVGARSLIYLRRRRDVKGGEFKRFVQRELVREMTKTKRLTELRSQVFMPWLEKLWDTPNVAHDNPEEQHFHASLIVGATDNEALRAVFADDIVAALSDHLARFVSAAHAYAVTEALTFVRNGEAFPHYEK